MLAMLRVAPLLPSPTLRAAANGPQVGTGKQAQSIELDSGVRRGAAWPPPVMHFYSGPPMHLLSGVDRRAFGLMICASFGGDRCTTLERIHAAISTIRHRDDVMLSDLMSGTLPTD